MTRPSGGAVGRVNGFVQTVFADVEPPVLGATYCPPAADVVAEYLSDISDGAGIGAPRLEKEMVPCLLVDNPSRFLAWR